MTLGWVFVSRWSMHKESHHIPVVRNLLFVGCPLPVVESALHDQAAGVCPDSKIIRCLLERKARRQRSAEDARGDSAPLPPAYLAGFA